MKIGDELYIPSAFYVCRGEDDIIGGLAKVKSIDENDMVEFEEDLGTFYNVECLLEEQGELKKEFGKKRAKHQPDLRPEFNDGGADWH